MSRADDAGDLMSDHDDLVAVFPCDLCEQPAAIIHLAPDGLIVVEALIGRSTQRIGGPGLARSHAILAHRNVRALYAVNTEWASFYCPTCGRSYCRAHWQLDVRYDDEYPGWYDCAYGVCPAGHRRLVDD